MKDELIIRKIVRSDNPHLSKIVRDTLTEFDCNKPGTAFADPETDFLFEQYADNKTAYFVAEVNHKIVGGSGIGKLKGFDSICELQKMYLIPEARNKGIARKLMDLCIDFAIENKFERIYLESMPQLKDAIKLYVKYGFHRIEKPLSQTGHFTCDVWMIKQL